MPATKKAALKKVTAKGIATMKAAATNAVTKKSVDKPNAEPKHVDLPDYYLPLANNSKAARRHRVLAPTLKPTHVSEEVIAEAVREFHRRRLRE